MIPVTLHESSSGIVSILTSFGKNECNNFLQINSELHDLLNEWETSAKFKINFPTDFEYFQGSL